MKKLLKTVNKLLFINFNRGGLILPLVLLILLFSSCGISIPAYLNPPIQLAELSFYHAYNNNPGNALGYEFFYRIYDEDTLNFSTVSNEAKSYFTETKLLGLLSNDRSIFEDSYYRRFYPTSDNIFTNFQNPAIPPIMLVDDYYFDGSDSSKNFEVYLDFNLSVDDDVELTTIGYNPDPISDYPSSINFGRYVTTDGYNYNYASFSDINPNQDDVPDTAVSPGNIAVFVVLYGLTDQFVSIFSDVVYIGSEGYTF